jgi:hypothetical protein
MTSYVEAVAIMAAKETYLLEIYKYVICHYPVDPGGVCLKYLFALPRAVRGELCVCVLPRRCRAVRGDERGLSERAS